MGLVGVVVDQRGFCDRLKLKHTTRQREGESLTPHLPMSKWTLLTIATAYSCLVLGTGVVPAADGEAKGPVRITFVGDVCLDGGPGHVITNGDDPFVGIAPWLRDTDLAIANLECAVPTSGKGKAEDKPYTFKAPTQSIPLLKRYFAAVSLANNHALDWGREGFLSQLELMEQEKLPYFGGGRDIDAARRPLILTAQGQRIALLGYCDFPPRSFAAGTKKCGTAWLVRQHVLEDIRRAREEYQADIVIPFLHWGTEHTPTPEQGQPELARSMIDAGADAVIGGHPHATQTVDWYQGKPVIYSLGNCVFNYFPHDLPIYYGWSVRLTFGKPAGIDLETVVLKLDPAGLPQMATSEDRYR
jgi:hypothetical protein